MNAFNYKGLAYNDLKEYKIAIDWFDKALQIDPKDTYALNYKGSALKLLN